MKRLEFMKTTMVDYKEIGLRLFVDHESIELALWLWKWWLSWELTSRQEEGTEGKEKEPG